MNKLPLLVGSALSGFNPNLGEPYHTSWNTLMMLNESAQYIVPNTTQPGWTYALRPTGVLTDYDELPQISPFSTTEVVPVDNDTFGVPMILSTHKPFPSYPVVMGRIKNIADCDRRGKLPKVFHGRFGCMTDFKDVDVFRYNFGASDSRFVSARITKNDNGFFALGLVLKLDPTGPTNYVDTPVEIMDGASGPITESISLVIWEDKVEVRYDDPGDRLIMSAPLTEPLINDGGNLMIIKGNQPMPIGTPPQVYGIDGVYIYEGTF